MAFSFLRIPQIINSLPDLGLSLTDILEGFEAERQLHRNESEPIEHQVHDHDDHDDHDDLVDDHDHQVDDQEHHQELPGFSSHVSVQVLSFGDRQPVSLHANLIMAEPLPPGLSFLQLPQLIRSEPQPASGLASAFRLLEAMHPPLAFHDLEPRSMVQSLADIFQPYLEQPFAPSPVEVNDPMFQNDHDFDPACDGTTCVVCMDDFSTGDRVLRLSCKHAFHPACIRKWLTECKPSCPMCQKNLLAD